MNNETAAVSRTERDYFGEVSIPADKLYGVNTVRGVQNLSVSSRTISEFPAFVRAFAQCKWAAALANSDVGVISGAQKEAIAQACRELIAGQFQDSLVVDLLEGSGGTSTNMNFNEVIANRAQQIMGGKPGAYDRVHPNDHVNLSQSTNDVYPAAVKIAAHAMLVPLIEELEQLAAAFAGKAAQFGEIVHLGRTCMQDAQPMRLGHVFGGYAALTRRLAQELSAVRDKLRTLPLGGTAIGTGFGATGGYRKAVYAHLGTLTGVDFESPADSFDAMQNMDVFSRVSGELRTCSAALAKVAADLIVLSSGPTGGIGEILLPSVQAGSSIMPGKVNPVLPMAIIQISFAVIGNDVSVAQAVQYGQLEINHFEQVVADRIFDSIQILTNGIRHFRTQCIDGLEANESANRQHLYGSWAVATALVPKLGYVKVSQLARQSVEQGRPLLDILDETGVLLRGDAEALILQASLPVFD